MVRRIILLLAIAASGFTVVVTQLQMRERIQGLISDRDKNAADRDQERGRADHADRTLTTTSNELVSTIAAFLSVSNELETSRGAVAQARSDLEKVTAEKQRALEGEKAARQELAQWNTLILRPEQVKPLLEDLAKARQANAVAEEQKKRLIRELEKTNAELAKILGSEAPVLLPLGLKGTVKVVDPKWQFVVLDIGESQGVLQDGIMLVHRDSKLIGKVKIAKVLAERSIANIIPASRLDDVREGDKVLF